MTAYYTAFRRGTLFRLRPADVDLTTGWLTVPGSFMKNGIGQKFRLGPDALTALSAIWNSERERIFQVSLNISDQGYLDKHFELILAMAGVEKSTRLTGAHFHKIRRTAVTLTAANVGMAQAIAIAGHSGADVNRRYIGASSPSTMRPPGCRRSKPTPSPPNPPAPPNRGRTAPNLSALSLML
jgi:integrase